MVITRTALESLFIPQSGQYITALLSQYVQYSSQYMYRTVITVCNAQRWIYLPHSGKNTYRNVLTEQWSLYV